MFKFLRSITPDINQGIREWKDTPGALLLDVREADEYAAGHVPHAQNRPLSRLETIETEITDKQIPLFVYCHSGARSGQAVKYLTEHGYAKVKNIGGIMKYTGEVETR
ncbi:MAG: rhodanese-like domain-containing protein [Bulleidia sp.]